jgi:hypothetical protein
MRPTRLTKVVSFGAILFATGALINRTQSKGTAEKLEGTVVAYDIVKATTPCYRRCEGSMIVRIHAAESESPRYARIDFTFRNGSGFPRELTRRKRMWQFSVIRTKSLDEPIYDYIVQKQSSYSEQKKYPNWELVPGAQDEKLPFGETLPSYELRGNNFKLIQ